jgi:uncharacterized protein YeeX (DUF496 family)
MIIGINLFNKNLNSELYINLIIRDNQKNDKLLEGVNSFITRQAMYYNVKFRRYRAIIVAVKTEYILHILNASL